MQQAHYHLLFNHLPIIIPFVGLAVLIVALILKSEIMKRTAYFIFILGAIGTLPASLTGEVAEHAIIKMDGVSKHLIHEHEEKAEVLTVLSYILGLISLLALWSSWKQKSFANFMPYVILALCAVLLFFAQQTGTTGGEIRHPEIRTEQVEQTEINQPLGDASEHKEEH